MIWTNAERPGYAGRKRDALGKKWDTLYGKGNWRIVWKAPIIDHLYPIACKKFYEESYFQYLLSKPELVDKICTYGEVIDNAMTNIQSGLDYTKQESYSTHIQDIAVRNVLSRLGREFTGKSTNILTIRSKDTNGYFLSPGVIPFMRKDWIHTPSLHPDWASRGSVEDFWQSNKYLQVMK